MQVLSLSVCHTWEAGLRRHPAAIGCIRTVITSLQNTVSWEIWLQFFLFLREWNYMTHLLSAKRVQTLSHNVCPETRRMHCSCVNEAAAGTSIQHRLLGQTLDGQPFYLLLMKLDENLHRTFKASSAQNMRKILITQQWLQPPSKGETHNLILVPRLEIEVGALQYSLLTIKSKTSPRGDYLMQVFMSARYIKGLDCRCCCGDCTLNPSYASES